MCKTCEERHESTGLRNGTEPQHGRGLKTLKILLFQKTTFGETTQRATPFFQSTQRDFTANVRGSN
jgi:hypothetical protein